MKVHHVGYLIKDMDKSIAAFRELGYTDESPPVFDRVRGINICFLINGNMRVELIEPAVPNSSVASILKKRGVGPYHICYETHHLEAAISELKALHYVICSPAEAAPALDNRRVVFLLHSKFGLIEIMEGEDEP